MSLNQLISDRKKSNLNIVVNGLKFNNLNNGNLKADNNGNVIIGNQDSGITLLNSDTINFNFTGVVNASSKIELFKYGDSLGNAFVIFEIDGFNTIAGTGNGGAIEANFIIPNDYVPVAPITRSYYVGLLNGNSGSWEMVSLTFDFLNFLGSIDIRPLGGGNFGGSVNTFSLGELNGIYYF